jgi:hypothetical protein
MSFDQMSKEELLDQVEGIKKTLSQPVSVKEMIAAYFVQAAITALVTVSLAVITDRICSYMKERKHLRRSMRPEQPQGK